MTEELKPCPLCGGAPSIECQDDSSPCIVMCMECYSVGPEKETAFEAIAAWNTRPPRVKALKGSAR